MTRTIIGSILKAGREPAQAGKKYKNNSMQKVIVKKPYNVDKLIERDISWKPVAHAATLEQAIETATRMGADGTIARVRVKATGEILYRGKGRRVRLTL